MIEERIDKLTAAIEANTAVLLQILASSGSAPVAEAPVEEAKPTKAKKKSEAAAPVVEAKEKEAPAPVVETEEAPAAEAPKFTVKDALEASKAKLGLDRDIYKPKLADLRAKFGIETVRDLAEDQVDAYMDELAKL